MVCVCVGGAGDRQTGTGRRRRRRCRSLCIPSLGQRTCCRRQPWRRLLRPVPATHPANIMCAGMAAWLPVLPAGASLVAEEWTACMAAAARANHNQKHTPVSVMFGAGGATPRQQACSQHLRTGMSRRCMSGPLQALALPCRAAQHFRPNPSRADLVFTNRPLLTPPSPQPTSARCPVLLR